MLDSIPARSLLGLLSATAGFSLVLLAPTTASAPARGVPSPPNAVEDAPHEPAAPNAATSQGLESSNCSPERRATLAYGVRAARADILTRYGRPPVSMEPPTPAEIDEMWPDAVATLTTCSPEPCRLLVATTYQLEDLQSIPEDLGYPNGVITAGSARGLTVYKLAFVADAMTDLERRFVDNAWNYDQAELHAMLEELAAEDADEP